MEERVRDSSAPLCSAGNDIICKSLKIENRDEGALLASPFGEGERIKVRGFAIARDRRVGCPDPTLTLPLSLAKGQAPAPTYSAPGFLVPNSPFRLRPDK
jgi:hypothetical protein